MKSDRTRNQIRVLETVFREVHDRFNRGKPVDRSLTGCFRRNRQMGSRDRRFISNAIFAYYRWYGWLHRLGPERTLAALLLGYILDGNEVDSRVRCGFERIEKESGIRLDPEKFGRMLSIQEKSDLFSESVFPVCPGDLVPASASPLSMEQIEALQTRPPVWVRLLKEAASSFLSFLESRQVVYRFQYRSRNALEILSPLNINESPDYRNGFVEIQDISSQAVGHICEPQPGSRWWDACAGSGGKALHLSALMQGSGAVFATEVDRFKLREMQRRVSRNNRFSHIEMLPWDGKHQPGFDIKMDGVLIDAPCSCSGTWRRNPELRWRLTRDLIAEYARVQLDLLNICCKSVSEEGVLVYATCSILPEENEQVVSRFLQQHPEFCPVRVENPLTGLSNDFGLDIGPPESDGNGMFVAKLQKRS